MIFHSLQERAPLWLNRTHRTSPFDHCFAPIDGLATIASLGTHGASASADAVRRSRLTVANNLLRMVDHGGPGLDSFFGSWKKENIRIHPHVVTASGVQTLGHTANKERRKQLGSCFKHRQLANNNEHLTSFDSTS